MGYSIDIYSVEIDHEKGTYSELSVIESTSLSYIWYGFSNYCPTHLLEGECTEVCEKVHLWYFPNDCHLRRGDDVAERATSALQILSYLGIYPMHPDTYHGEEMKVRKNRFTVFAYYLERFRDLGLKYSDHFFIGDRDSNHEDYQLLLPDGRKLSYVNDRDDNKNKNIY